MCGFPFRRYPGNLNSWQVDEMYRAGVKPWNSAEWKPHLGEEAHENAIKGLHDQEQDEEKRVSQGS